MFYIVNVMKIQVRFSFDRSKEKLAKEKSPAGEKLPEILSQWLQEFQLLTRWRSFVKQEILAYAIAQNFYDNFSQAGQSDK